MFFLFFQCVFPPFKSRLIISEHFRLDSFLLLFPFKSSKLVLEYEQVVSGCDGYDVLGRMPGRVENFLVEIQTVDTDLVLFSFASRANLLGFECRLGSGNFSRSLQRDIAFGSAIKHAKEIVIRPRQDGLVVVAPAALKLIKDAIVLVE